MKDHGDQLREAFETHEGNAPDAAAVFARVQELSRTYQRRRLGGQVAGGAVLGAGLIAGMIQLPAMLPGDPAPGATAIVAAAPPVPSTPVSALPSAPDEPSQPKQRYWQAYFDAGYDYDDAVRLSHLWQSAASMSDVKAEAGRRLLAGETLPFAATPETPGTEEPVDPQLQRQMEAYFFAGYGSEDAVRLARLWKLADPADAKAEAGKRLLAGQPLPFKPDPAEAAAGLESRRVAAFFDAGYDYDDAVELAKIWKKKDAYQAKVEGGKRLLAGQQLPIRP